jgi:NAD(P)-dependent dehydrogenase (short-subunit alcohol dehydrogenase family)
MKLDFEFEKGFLDKKNILVTGASKGIGREIALGLSKFGANVILHGRSEDALDEIYDEIISKYKTDPMIIKCDLNLLDEDKSKEIAEVISKNISCLDGIINNAAIIGRMSSITDFGLDTWQKVLNTNLTSSFLLVKYLSPLMENSERPRIIFTSSGVASKGKAFWGAYAISKAAVKSLSEILQEELEPLSKIKVFNFDPGATRTSMRAYAYPAEDPSSLKGTSSLLNYYLWFFSRESENIDSRYIKYNIPSS